MRNILARGTLQANISDYENTGNASYVTTFNQNFSIIEEKVLQNRISILDSIICIVFAVILLLYMNPIIAVVSIIAMSIPSLLPNFFNKVLGKHNKWSWNLQQPTMKQSQTFLMVMKW